MIRLSPRSTLFPYTTLFRSEMSSYDRFAPGPASTYVLFVASGTHTQCGGKSDGQDGSALELMGDPVEMVPSVAAERLEPERRSEEHTSELQSQFHLVCRLLL